MTLTGRDKKLLVVLGILALLAAYWLLALQPKREEVSRLNKQVAAKKSDIEAAKMEITTAEAAKTSYASDYSTVVRLGEAIPKDDDIPSLLVQLDSLAGDYVDFTKINIDKYPPSLLTPSTAGAPAAPQGGGAQPASSTTSSGKAQASGATSTAGGQQSGLPFQPVEARLQFQGNFFDLHKVMEGIDDFVRLDGENIAIGGRLVLVGGFKIKAGREGFPKVAVNVGAIIFSLPEGESIAAGATPQTPPQGGPESISNSQQAEGQPVQ